MITVPDNSNRMRERIAMKFKITISGENITDNLL